MNDEGFDPSMLHQDLVNEYMTIALKLGSMLARDKISLAEFAEYRRIAYSAFQEISDSWPLTNREARFQGFKKGEGRESSDEA